MDQRPARAADPAIDTLPGVLTLLAAAAQVAAAFLVWSTTGAVGVDLSIVASDRPAAPSIGMALVALAALPGLAALVTRRGWPRTVSAAGTAVLVLGWLALGPEAALVTGVWVAIAATVTHLLAAALAD